MSTTLTDKEYVNICNELDYLRYFYDAVESSLGPASDDIYSAIANDYVEEGNVLPDDYKPSMYEE